MGGKSRGRRGPGYTAAVVLVAAAVGFVGTACGDGAADALATWGGRIDTLSGGGFRVVSPVEGLWTQEAAWRLVEDLRIGSLEGGGPDMFGGVGDVAVDGEGRLYVLETQAHEVRVFGSDGSHLRTFGREGEGPGELSVGFGGEIVIDARGRVLVNNSMNRRWEVFTADGGLVGSAPQRSNFVGGSTVMGLDGSLYQPDRVSPPAGGDSRPVVRRWELKGASLVNTDTLAIPELPARKEVGTTASLPGGGSLSIDLPVPFAHQPGWTFDPAGHFWVEPGDGYRLVALGPDHDTLRVIERAYEPVPVTEEEIEELRVRLESGAPPVELPRSRIPEHHPPFDLYRTDPTGNLWVRRILGEERRGWEVFDPEGRFLGAVESDVDLSALTVHEITTDAVYGMLRGELDEPYVVRLAIVRGSR